MDIILITIASFLMIAGIAGCFLPVVPGPPLNYAGILLLNFTSMVDIQSDTLLLWALATAVIVIADFYLPAYAVKKFGSSKTGYYFSIGGVIVGLIFFGVVGSVIAPFIAALIGEMITGKNFNDSIRPALGSFFGIISGIFLKLAISIFFTIKFIWLIIEAL